jgi:starvation-inducible DNA-binding protein
MSLKFAASKEDEDIDLDTDEEVSYEKLPEAEMKKYLSLLKALQAYYQHAHWISKGEPFYGDHLLFERLYGTVNEQIDSLAEKMVALGGDHYVCVRTVMKMTSEVLQKIPEMGEDTLGLELAQSALKLEKMFLSSTKNLYNKLKEDEALTLGLDDMLMSFYNEHEGNVYLLTQRTKG